MTHKFRLRRKLDLVAITALTIVAFTASAASSPSTDQPHPSRIAQNNDAPGAAETFQLNAVSVEGATVYRPEELVRYYEPYLTQEVSQADLVQIAADITDRYRADGYFLSQAVVLPQNAATGVARIRVYEGYVESVETTGSGRAAAQRSLKGLAGARPLRLSELDRRLSQIRDVPGVTLKPSLVPDIDDLAKHKLVVDSELKRAAFTAYADNRGPKTAGPWQVYLTAAFNSVAKVGDRLGFAVLAVPTQLREFVYGEANYTVPVSERSSLRGYVGLSKTHDGADPASPDVGGESWSTGLSYVHNLKRSRDVNAWMRLSGDVRHIEHDWADVGGYRDDLRVARAALGMRTDKAGKALSVSGEVSAGRRGQPAPDRGLSRFDADRGFVKVSAHASHYQDIGRHAGLYVSADAQWSPNALLASEELNLGGAAYGRGYIYGEISGDRGVAASAELRAGWDPKPDAIKYVQGFAFLDGGKVWNIGPFPNAASLASAGLGVRVRTKNDVFLTVEAARPLTRTPYDKGRKDWRPTLTLSAAF